MYFIQSTCARATLQRLKNIAQYVRMWVSGVLASRVRKISFFVIIVALVTTLLYVLSYENWIKDTSPATLATSTLETMTGTTEDASSTVAISDKSDKSTEREKTITPWKATMTTLFWVGEPADPDNAYITNVESYWDEKWEVHFGGVDDPNCRTGFVPCAFKPKENPFYFALPYADYDAAGNLKQEDKKVPWYGKDTGQLLKNRWIAVRHAGKTCYAQWEDVGPNGEDDFSYVFGNKKPVNTFGEKAGLDISPALWKCLQMSDNGVTDWAFVDVSDVPSGPWRETLTTSGTSWSD
jgi:hypothetical protein